MTSARVEAPIEPSGGIVPQVPLNSFDRGKPFYPLVMHYLAQLFGIKELLVRGVAGSESLGDLVGKIPALVPEISAGGSAKTAEVLTALRKLSGPLELRSEYQENHILIDIGDIARDMVANHSYLLSWTMRSAGNLLILAHEVSKDALWHDRGPLWEFLRHCRNAAAHGGTFSFRHDEPQRPAVWGDFAITAQLQGTLLFKDGARGAGLLSPGDPIRLLWDIEQAYPHMHA